MKVGDLFVELQLKTKLVQDLRRELAVAQAAASRPVEVKVKLNNKAILSELRTLNQTMKDMEVKVQVDVDASIAKAKIKDITKDETKEVHVRADTDQFSAATARATTSMAALAFSLGPGLIPVAGAASAALIAVGGALGVAGAAAGTAALAFSGVGDALKALGNANVKGAREAVTLAASQRAAASAVASAQAGLTSARRAAASSAKSSARAIRNALQGVANAERNAARAAEDAAERVKDARERVVRATEDGQRRIRDAFERQQDAEDNLKDAQKDALKIQGDINRAREEAAEDIEDLQLKLRGLGLDETEAAAAVEKARKRLENARTFAGIPQSILDRLQLAYDQEVQSLDEIKDAREDTAKEADEAAKKGVEGSDKVVDAKEAEADALERVTDAQKDAVRATEDLKQAQVDSARAIRDAQEDLTDALKDQAQSRADSAREIKDAEQSLADARASAREQAASSAAAVEGAERGLNDALANQRDAMDKLTPSAQALADAMANLSPTGQDFVKFLYDLKPALDSLKFEAQDTLFPHLQRAIEKLLPLLGPLKRTIHVVADEMGKFFEGIADWVANGAGARFLKLIRDLSGPLFDALLTTVTSLGDAFLTMGEKAKPITIGIADGIANLAKKFSAFVSSPEFDKFLQWASSSIATVGENLQGIAQGILALLQAAEPWGKLVLGTFEAIGRLIAAIPMSVLTPIVTTLLAVATAVTAISQAAALFSSVKNAVNILKTFNSAVSGIFKNGGTKKVTTAMQDVAAGINTVGTAAENAGGKGGPKTGKIGKFTGALSGGMSMLGGPWGIAIAGATIGLGYFLQKNADAKAKVDDLTKSLDQQTGALTTDTYSILAKDIDSNLVRVMDLLGISLQDMTKYAGEADRDGFQKLIESTIKLNPQLGANEYTVKNIMHAYDQMAGPLQEANDKFDDQQVVTESLAGNLTKVETAQDDVKDATDDLAKAQQDLKDAYDDVYDSLSLVNDEFTTENDNKEDVEQSTDDLAEAVKNHTGRLFDNRGELDLNNASQRHVYDSMKDVAGAIGDTIVEQAKTIEKTKGHNEAMKFLNETLDGGIGKEGSYKQKLYETARQAGLTKEEARLYAEQLGKTPEEIKTAFSTPGIKEAEQKVSDMENKLDQLTHRLDVLTYMANSKRPLTEAQAQAEISETQRENARANRGGAGSHPIDLGPNISAAGVAQLDETDSHVDALAKMIQSKLDKIMAETGADTAAGPSGTATGHNGGGRIFAKHHPAGSTFLSHAYYGGAPYAMDIPVPTGTPVYAPWGGQLKNAWKGANSYGNLATLYGTNGLRFKVAHLSRFAKSGGKSKGDLIGFSGATGRVTGPHAHIEVHKGFAGWHPVNPANYLKYDTGGLLPHGGGAINLSKKPEAILTYTQWKTLERIAKAAEAGTAGGSVRTGPAIVVENFNASNQVDINAFMQAAEFAVSAGRIR